MENEYRVFFDDGNFFDVKLEGELRFDDDLFKFPGKGDGVFIRYKTVRAIIPKNNLGDSQKTIVHNSTD